MEQLTELLKQLESDLESFKETEKTAAEKIKATTTRIKKVKKLIDKWK